MGTRCSLAQSTTATSESHRTPSVHKDCKVSVTVDESAPSSAALVQDQVFAQAKAQAHGDRKLPARFRQRVVEDPEEKRKRLEAKMKQADAKREALAAERKAKAAKASARLSKAKSVENTKLRVPNSSDAVPDVFKTRSHGEDAPVALQRADNNAPTGVVGGFTADSGW